VLKYPKLIGSHLGSSINRWLMHDPAISQLHFGITEKLDGANFQIRIDKPTDTEPRLFSRNQETDWGFFNVGAIRDHIMSHIPRLQMLSRSYNCTPVSFFGELTGPNINGRCLYSGLGPSQLMFRIFDICIHGGVASDFWMLPVQVEYIFADRQWCLAPKVAVVEGLDNALEYDTKFNSLVTPAGVDTNLCEGVVIRPYMAEVGYKDPTEGWKQFILKKKNEEFADGKAKRQSKPKVELEPHVQELQDKFRAMLSHNRVLDYFSKEGRIVDTKQIGPYIAGISKDAIDDLILEHPEFQHLDKKERKQITCIAGRVISKLLMEEL
jgi:hypothetical protein